MNNILLPWGRYPARAQRGMTCHWQDEIPSQFAQARSDKSTLLAFGNGRSYGDSCLGRDDCVIHTRALNKFISADWECGLIRAEAGVTLEEIIAVALPQGWFLPVTPGTQYVTLGGAVANDVHGKNHHKRGTFGCHIKAFGLYRSDQPELICTRENHSELFNGTIGGLGLTGIITWVELQLIKVESAYINTNTIKFGSLAEFFALSHQLDHQHEYSVAWIDCIAKGANMGRGLFSVGDHCLSGDLNGSKKNKLSVPFELPISAVNSYSLRIFNTVYYNKQITKKSFSRQHYEPFFYPLDSIHCWNRIYGPRGFQQFQCVIPDKDAETAISELLKVIAVSAQGSFLAVLKRCGNIPSPGLLSFPLSGTSLALDFPNNRTHNRALFDQLDAIVHEANGRLYPAKDAHMKSIDFRKAYPQWNELEKLRDPILCSQFWQRVALI